MMGEVCMQPARFGGILRPNASLARMTGLGVGGAARLYAEPIDALDLRHLILEFRGEPLRVVGHGTGMLVTGAGLTGLTLSLKSMEFRGRVWKGSTVRVGAGTRLSLLVHETVRRGLGGLEFAAGMPGTVGGAVLQDVSHGGRRLGELIERTTWVDAEGQLQQLTAADLEPAWKYGVPPIEGVMVEAMIRLVPTAPEVLQRELLTVLRWRRAHQPVGLPCVGPVFREPAGIGLRELLDEAIGARGWFRGVGPSRLDANYLVRSPEASADDVVDFIDHVRSTVWRTHGIRLELRLDVAGRERGA